MNFFYLRIRDVNETILRRELGVRTVKRILHVAVVCAVLLSPAFAPAQNPGDRWRNMSPKERQEVLKNYQRWQRLPPRDKERLREEWDRWQNLPKDQRDRLRRRYDELRRQDRSGESDSRRERDRDRD